MAVEDDYNALVEALDTVLDAGGADENHPLAALADRMGELVAQYEDVHLPPIPASGIDALKFLSADKDAFKRILTRQGGQAPCEGDELPT